MADESPKPLTVLTTMLKPARGPDEWERQLVERDIPTDELKSGLDAFVDQMRWIAQNAIHKGRTSPENHSGEPLAPKDSDNTEELLLDEVSFHAEVSPQGEFKLVGSGGQPAGSGVSFVWRRKHVFGTADLNKSLVSSVVNKDGTLPNEMRVALVGPAFDPAENLQVKTEIVNVVRTTIQDFVNVILIGP
jgi:hypothetical protein